MILIMKYKRNKNAKSNFYVLFIIVTTGLLIFALLI